MSIKENYKTLELNEEALHHQIKDCVTDAILRFGITNEESIGFGKLINEHLNERDLFLIMKHAVATQVSKDVMDKLSPYYNDEQYACISGDRIGFSPGYHPDEDMFCYFDIKKLVKEECEMAGHPEDIKDAMESFRDGLKMLKARYNQLKKRE